MRIIPLKLTSSTSHSFTLICLFNVIKKYDFRELSNGVLNFISSNLYSCKCTVFIPRISLVIMSFWIQLSALICMWETFLLLLIIIINLRCYSIQFFCICIPHESLSCHVVTAALLNGRISKTGQWGYNLGMITYPPTNHLHTCMHKFITTNMHVCSLHGHSEDNNRKKWCRERDRGQNYKTLNVY